MTVDDYCIEENREIEEAYARAFLGDEEVQVSFLDVDEPYHDENRIVVNPGIQELYQKNWMFALVEKELGMKDVFSSDEEMRFRIITRIQMVRECLKIKYSADRKPYEFDVDMLNPAYTAVMKVIYETIDDCFLDAMAVCEYPAIEPYVKVYRLLMRQSKKDPQAVVWKQLKIGAYLEPDLYDILCYMRSYMLYPMDRKEPKHAVENFVYRVMPYYMAGSISSRAETRYQYAKDVLKGLEYFLPKEWNQNTPSNPEGLTIEDEHPDGDQQTVHYDKYNEGFLHDTPRMKKNPYANQGKAGGQMALPAMRKSEHQESYDDEVEQYGRKNGNKGGSSGKEGTKNHSNKMMEDDALDFSGKSVGEDYGDENTTDLTRRLFESISGELLPMGTFQESVFFREDKKLLRQNETVHTYTESAEKYAISTGHEQILIKVVEKENFGGGRKFYASTVRQYRSVIRNYRMKIYNILKTPRKTSEGKKYIGYGLDHKRLYDHKKRYWYKNEYDIGMPELSILFMIDCSGSMDGERKVSVVKAIIIMNEVLKQQGIKYAVFGHKAITGTDTVKHTIFLDFDAKEKDKYRICDISVDNGSRDGITLLWAEKYLAENAPCEHPVIVVISDGLPNHLDTNGIYQLPFSAKDSYQAAQRITRRGTKIVAVALNDGGDNCYRDLQSIYPKTIACDDLGKLPKQLLEIIAEQMNADR